MAYSLTKDAKMPIDAEIGRLAKEAEARAPKVPDNADDEADDAAEEPAEE